MDIMTALTKASEMLATYSDGRLPRPASISVGSTFIAFNMSEAEDVIRWAESVDGHYESVVTKPNELTGQRYHQTTVSFKHDDTHVWVSNSHELTPDELAQAIEDVSPDTSDQYPSTENAPGF
jgi:hypothetical protein